MNIKLQMARQEIMRACAARNISIQPYGKGLRLIGQGIDLITMDLAYVRVDELNSGPRAREGFPAW